jgi:hypothetical protein
MKLSQLERDVQTSVVGRKCEQRQDSFLIYMRRRAGLVVVKLYADLHESRQRFEGVG